MQLGACLAGLAIENSMLGAAHALANPLTATYGVAHGEAVALMLPHVIRHNGKHVGKWYRELVQCGGAVQRRIDRRFGPGRTGGMGCDSRPRGRPYWYTYRVRCRARENPRTWPPPHRNNGRSNSILWKSPSPIANGSMNLRFKIHRMTSCRTFCVVANGITLHAVARRIGQSSAATSWAPASRKSDVPEALDVLWTYKAAEDAGFDATAVVKDGVVYVGDSAGTFHAVNVTDGTAVWTKQFTDMGFAAGAAVDKDRMYVGDLDGVVRCLAIADGNELWTYKLEGEIFAGPTPHGDDVLVTSESGTLACLNTADGKNVGSRFKSIPRFAVRRRFRRPRHARRLRQPAAHHQRGRRQPNTTVEIDGPTGSTPAIRGERVIFGTEGGTFFAIDVPADGG